MRSFLRRWRVPIALSLLLNLWAFTLMGSWYGANGLTMTQRVRTHMIHLVEPPRIAATPQLKTETIVVKALPKPKPKRDRPQEALNHNRIASAERSGIRRVPRRIVTRATEVASNPAPAEQSADRDPFMPTVAPAAKFAPTRALQTTPVLVPAQPSPKPTQIASVSGQGAPAATPVASTTPAANPGPVHVGFGGNGLATGGNGSGAGGVLPFGLGGRGGNGQHRIVYVLDVSPSMWMGRIERARQELRSSIANLTPDDLFDIFAFGGDVEKMAPYLDTVTPDTLSQARWFIDHINEIPSTNLEEALTEALDMNHVNEIVVITDGEPTSGETNFQILATEIRNRNINHIRIDTVGLVGINPVDGTDDTFEAASLLRRIAHDSGGSARLVPLGAPSDD